jgi:membrane-associated protease RseP (regulator of RpoE activity)
MRVDSDRDFLTTLFDPRWRDQRVSVIIYRHGRPWTVYMHPSQLVTEYTTVAAGDPLEDYGLILDDRYDDYVVVWRVTPRSPAYYAGLRPGDVITTFDGRRLSGRDDFVRWMSQGNLDNVALDINRNRQLRRIDFDLSRAGVRTGARTSLRPDFDASGRFDGNLDGRLENSTQLDGRMDTRFDSRTDTRFDASPGSRFEARPDTRFEARPDNRFDATPDTGVRGTIPNRLRGSAAGGVDVDAQGTVQPGIQGGTIQPGIQGGTRIQGSTGVQGTVQPGVQGGIRSGIQGGVRGGGLFRGNR